MKTIVTAHPGEAFEISTRGHAYQAYLLLHWVFVIAPIIAGLDKFFDKLTNWSLYLWAPLARAFGGADIFMRIAGAIEILAGCLVAFKPRIGAPIVSVWLLGIMMNLLLLGSYYDIALRDFGLCLASFALFRLSYYFDPMKAVNPT